jgi:hypothetical protein
MEPGEKWESPEYWNEPSPMTMIMGRLRPVWRSPSAMPTDAGRLQPSPPLAMVKKDAGSVIGQAA